MASLSALLLLLKLLMILISIGWASLWLLKPTQLWTTKWKGAEEIANSTVLGYSGLNFVVYTFPVIVVAMVGFVYLELKTREPRIGQQRSTTSIRSLSNPLVVNSFIGILSGIEILVVTLFILFLAWTFYARISNDFTKKMPIKSFKLSSWEFKLFRTVTRFGLLAEACLALLLLPVLRRMALFQLLGIQFEASVRYHVWLGTAMMFFATLHGGGTLFIWGLKYHIQDEIWKWQKTGRIYLAGELALITGLVIWITSLPPIRRRKFELFYYTHHLYILFLVLFLFHGGDLHFYMVFPGIFLFGLDKLLRIIQSRPQTHILSARLFPCKAIELTLPKHPRLKYTPTSVLFMKIPSISKLQWHSFSVTSASSADEQTMSVIIKCEGCWTSSLHHLITSELHSKADHTKCIPVAIEGPYGPATLDFLRYDSLLLVAGGIGITPFLSILQEIDSAHGIGRKRLPIKIQLIYATKKFDEISLLNPIFPLLLHGKSENYHLTLKLFVTQEEQRSGATLLELFHKFSHVETINFDTEFSNYATHGPEGFVWLATIVGFSSIMFLVFLVSFNHAFLKPAKQAPKQKNPSSLTDLLLLCSFGLAITMGALMAILLRWKKPRKEPPPFTQKPSKAIKPISMEMISSSFEEHEIHFRTRPNFQDIISNFPNETGGINIGVLVCGPETMKESVASVCKLNSQGLKILFAQERKKPYFNFHSLNFNL